MNYKNLIREKYNSFVSKIKIYILCKNNSKNINCMKIYMSILNYDILPQ